MSASPPPLRVAIVGLGRAGASYPAVQAPDGSCIERNHLAAALAEGAEVAALVDSDADARTAARLQLPAAADVAEADRIAALPPGVAEVGVLATPPRDREAEVAALLGVGCRIVVCEKPLAENAAAARRIVAAAADAGAVLRVNFNRRFDTAVQRFRAGWPEMPVAVDACYGKGLRNYGSHMLDLLAHWLGPATAVRAIAGPTGDGDDPSHSFQLELAGGTVATVLGLDGLAYDRFEATFHGRTEVWDLRNGGAEKWRARPVDGLYYPGYAQLAPAEAIEPPTPVGGYRELYRALVAHRADPHALAGCTGDEAVANLAAIEAVIDSARQGGVRIPLQPAPHAA